MFALLVLLPIIGVGGFHVLAQQREVFAEVQVAGRAQNENDDALRLTGAEEAAMRGYALTHQRFFLSSYDAARLELVLVFEALRADVARLPAADALPHVDRIRALHARWIALVVDPTFSAQRLPRRRLLEGEGLIGAIRAESARLDDLLQARNDQAQEKASAGFRRVGIATASALVLAALAIIVFTLRAAQMAAEAQRDRTAITTLQHVFANRWQRLDGTRVGVAYVASTAGANIGGDLFNVRKLQGEERGYVLVGDIAGKGLDAAVDTTYVRYAVGTLVQIFEDPALVFDRFNLQYARSVAERDSFVVAFLGILDMAALELRYASAGHPGAWLVRAGTVRTLPVTGAILGVIEDERYRTESIELMIGDVLVLATDGLTEARDPAHEMLGIERASQWIATAPHDDPQRLVDTLVARLRTFAGRRIVDDLAVVAIRIEGVVPDSSGTRLSQPERARHEP